jgi:hypothetical protein
VKDTTTVKTWLFAPCPPRQLTEDDINFFTENDIQFRKVDDTIDTVTSVYRSMRYVSQLGCVELYTFSEESELLLRLKYEDCITLRSTEYVHQAWF